MNPDPATLPLRPAADCGYSRQDITDVARSMSEEIGVGFIDTDDLIEHDDLPYIAKRFSEVSENNQTIIFGPLYTFHDEKEWNMLGRLAPIIKAYQDFDQTQFSTAVIPLAISYRNNSKTTHAMTLMINHDRKNNVTDIVMLEQHAQEHGASLDYSEEIDKVLDALRTLYEESPQRSVITFRNTKAIAPVIGQGVCCVVALETCGHLAFSDNPSNLARTPEELHLSKQEILDAHERNILRSLEHKRYLKHESNEPKLEI